MPICPDYLPTPFQHNPSAWYPTAHSAQHRPLYYQGLGSYAEWLGLADSAEIAGLEKLEWEVFGLGVEEEVEEEGDELNGIKNEGIEEVDEEELDRGGRGVKKEREDDVKDEDDVKEDDDIEEEDAIKEEDTIEQEHIKTGQDTKPITLAKPESTRQGKAGVKRKRDEEETGSVKRIRV
jgi:hypothetical protein